MKRHKDKTTPHPPIFLRGDECDRIYGTTPEFRKQQRCSGEWREPVHFIRLNSRNIVYRSKMIESWIENRDQTEKHLAEAENLLRKHYSKNRQAA